MQWVTRTATTRYENSLNVADGPLRSRCETVVDLNRADMCEGVGRWRPVGPVWITIAPSVPDPTRSFSGHLYMKGWNVRVETQNDGRERIGAH